MEVADVLHTPPITPWSYPSKNMAIKLKVCMKIESCVFDLPQSQRDLSHMFVPKDTYSLFQNVPKAMVNMMTASAKVGYFDSLLICGTPIFACRES